MEFKPLVSLSYEFFFTIINTIALFFILRRLLFKPVIKIIDDRERDIKDRIDEGNRAQEEGLKFKEEYEGKLDQVKNQGQEILELSKKKADERAEKIIFEARQEASAIKEKASLDIMLDERQTGRAWLDIVTAESRPLVVEQISSVMASLASAGGAWRREQAHALAAEQVSINRIAAMFGVTRQRISALLRERARGAQ